MNFVFKKILLLLFLISIGKQIFAQKKIVSGSVKNAITNETISAVSITIQESTAGTYSNDKGAFKISVDNLPVKLVVSSIGYDSKIVECTNVAFEHIKIELMPSNKLGQEVVIAASRVPEKIMESPVSIERITNTNIRNATGANYYDVLTTLKGVDVTTSSLTFKTPTTRGFNSSGNTRFNQIVDGMDNQAPGLNFSVASLIGLSELDIDNMELLSGASSALYGSGGMNGTLLLNSKNPFKYQGLSFMVKEGVMNINNNARDNFMMSPFHNISSRWAYKVSDKFAFKINVELLSAVDWLASDYRNYARASTGGKVIAGTRESDPNYDGINVYGDETTVEIRKNILEPFKSLIPNFVNFLDHLNNGNPINVSRTGYTEKEVINPNTNNYKIGTSLHYKLSKSTELLATGYWGTGNTTYTGSERYSLENFAMGQYKLELANKNWTIRAYTTQENSGNSYNTTIATRLLNETWKPSVYYVTDPVTHDSTPKGWYIDYATTYVQSRLNGMTDSLAHAAARAFADIGRPSYSSDQFKKIYDSIRSKSIANGGAKLVDHSSLYVTEGSYNLSSITSRFFDLMVGANYKYYTLNSEGTLFADKPGSSIGIGELGCYFQASRNMLEKIKITFSGRYDKNQNFAGRFTPRLTALYKVAHYNNLRFSYQTAYRFPSNQQQWIDLDVGSSIRLIGGNEYFTEKYNLIKNPVYDFESLRAGKFILFTPITLKPESVSSFELGYKGLLDDGKMMIDLYGYWGEYQDFLGRKLVVQNKANSPIELADTINGARYSVPLNLSDKVNTLGFGLSIDYRLPNNFMIGTNFSTDQLKGVPSDFVAYFNSPICKFNLYVSNIGFGPQKLLGFTVNYKWQPGFYYEGDFATGNLPEIQTIDAQLSCKIPSTKSIIKVGANNLLNQYYYNAPGNSHVGGLYYVSYGFNIY